MRRARFFIAGLGIVLVLGATGCGKKEKTMSEEEMFADDLRPLDEEELQELEEADQSDDQFSVVPDTDENITEDGEFEVDKQTEDPSSEKIAEENTYTSKDEVARYIYTFHHLPSNYITKKEAQNLGWDENKKNLKEVAPGKSIGGDEYSNADKMLPEEKGRIYYECDINAPAGERGNERLIYSNDGLVFYTDNNVDTFEPIY